MWRGSYWAKCPVPSTSPRSYSPLLNVSPCGAAISPALAPGSLKRDSLIRLWFIVGIYTPPPSGTARPLRSLIAGLRPHGLFILKTSIYLTILLDVNNADDITECNIVLMITITLIGFSMSTPWGDAKTFCVPIDNWVLCHELEGYPRNLKYVLRRISCNNRLAAIFLTDDTKWSVRRGD